MYSKFCLELQVRYDEVQSSPDPSTRASWLKLTYLWKQPDQNNALVNHVRLLVTYSNTMKTCTKNIYDTTQKQSCLFYSSMN